MTEETGTLAELNVRPGDVVECVRDAGYGNYTNGKNYTVGGDWRVVNDNGNPANGIRSIFRIVSRASDPPKTWGEMTDAEKGAILLAEHRGEVVEWMDPNGKNDEWDRKGFVIGFPDMAYRVRPEPKRETVSIYGAPSKHIQWCLEQCGLDTHRITMPLLDGNIPAGTYTSEAGETIIVEEL